MALQEMVEGIILSSGFYIGPLPTIFIFSLILLYRIPGPEYVFMTNLDEANDDISSDYTETGIEM